MRQQTYPGSEITFEQTLESEENYSQYVVFYQSDGYKIYALMTIPNEAKPDTGCSLASSTPIAPMPHPARFYRQPAYGK